MIRLALALALATAACGPTEEAVNPTYTDIADKIFVPGCATSACHSVKNKSTTDGPGAGLILDKATGHANLMGKQVQSTNWPDADKDFKLVDPGNPDKSALMLTLTQPADVPFALHMPGGATLSAARIEVIRQWIADGAKNN